jgi:hypothetical protein
MLQKDDENRREGATCEVIDKEGKSCVALTIEPGFTMFFNLETRNSLPATSEFR